jgi:hypothetical protein
MRRIKNASASDTVEWTQDGLAFTEIIRQEYGANGCVFSAGMVEGHPVDTLYLRWLKDGDEGGMLLLRPDEMAAIGWLATGVLYSHHIETIIGDDKCL